MKALVKKATREDAPQLVRFQVMMAMETEELKLDERVVTQGVAALFDHPHRGNYWVARREDRAGDETGEIMGCLLTIPEWSDWRNGTVLWIHSVYIKEEYRGQGVFKQLYLHLKDLVNQSGSEYRGLRLYVHKNNLRAQKVYQQLGMDGDHYQLYEWLK